MIPFARMIQYGNISKVLGGTFEEITTTLVSRYEACTCVVGDLIYIYGGTRTFNSAATSVNQFCTFNTLTYEIQELTITPPARFGAAMTELNGKIYLYGGISSGNAVNANLWVYDISTDTWTQITNASGTIPGTKAYHSMCTIDGTVRMIGGAYGGTGNTGCFIYNPDTNIWSSMAGLPIADNTLNGTCTDGTIIYSHYASGYNTMFQYNPVLNSWYSPPTDNSTSLGNSRICYRDGVIYLNRSGLFGSYTPNTNQWRVINSLAPSVQYNNIENTPNGVFTLFGAASPSIYKIT